MNEQIDELRSLILILRFVNHNLALKEYISWAIIHPQWRIGVVIDVESEKLRGSMREDEAMS